MSLTIFLPVRKGSERVKDKNTRVFANIEGGLLELKLQQLIKIESAEEILVSTNDEKCRDIVLEYQEKDSRVILNERPEHLGQSGTALEDLIKYVPELTKSENILWTHCTSPFCDEDLYERAIKLYVESNKNGFDGLLSGRDYRDFLIEKKSGKLVNNNIIQSWPRTQDLEDWFEINNAIFLTNRSNFERGDRAGNKPFLMEMDKVSSLDIDCEEDFKIAEILYGRI